MNRLELLMSAPNTAARLQHAKALEKTFAGMDQSVADMLQKEVHKKDFTPYDDKLTKVGYPDLATQIGFGKKNKKSVAPRRGKFNLALSTAKAKLSPTKARKIEQKTVVDRPTIGAPTGFRNLTGGEVGAINQGYGVDTRTLDNNALDAMAKMFAASGREGGDTKLLETQRATIEAYTPKEKEYIVEKSQELFVKMDPKRPDVWASIPKAADYPETDFSKLNNNLAKYGIETGVEKAPPTVEKVSPIEAELSKPGKKSRIALNKLRQLKAQVKSAVGNATKRAKKPRNRGRSASTGNDFMV
jgi:hypothetical protein